MQINGSFGFINHDMSSHRFSNINCYRQNEVVRGFEGQEKLDEAQKYNPFEKFGT